MSGRAVAERKKAALPVVTPLASTTQATAFAPQPVVTPQSVPALSELEVVPAREGDDRAPREPVFAHDFSRILVSPPTALAAPPSDAPALGDEEPGGGHEFPAPVATPAITESGPPAIARSSPTHAFSRVSVLQPQAKLAVSQPGDPAEQEAERVADEVLGMDAPGRAPAPAVEATLAPALHRQQGDAPPPGAPSPLAGGDIAPGDGQPLDSATRTYMEPRFGHDFGRVRVHTDARAAEAARGLQARAYAVGGAIVFGAGQYAPGTADGDRLLAHELTHIVQQSNGSGAAARRWIARAAATLAPPAPAVAAPRPAEPVEAIVAQMLDSVRTDPDDQTGQVRSRLAGLDDATRAAVLAQLQTRLDPAQWQRLSNLLPGATSLAAPAPVPQAPAATPADQGPVATAAPTATEEGPQPAGPAPAPLAAPAATAAAAAPAALAAPAVVAPAGPAQPGGAATPPTGVPTAAPSAAAPGVAAPGGPDVALPAAGPAAAPGAPAAGVNAPNGPAAATPVAGPAAGPAAPAGPSAAAPSAPAPAATGPAGPAAQDGPPAAPGPADKAPSSPQEDPGFQAVVKQAHGVAAHQATHAPAAAKAGEAQLASNPPGHVATVATAKHVAELEQEPAKPFDRAAFKAALLEKIAATTPKNLEEADDFKSKNKLDGVKGDLNAKVASSKDQSQGPIQQKAKEPPNPSGIPPKEVVPLPPAADGPPPPPIDAAQAAPKPKTTAEVSLDAGGIELEQKMSGAKITEQQLLQSNEPEFKGAVQAKQTAQADAAQAPVAYRKSEQGILEQAQGTAQATARTQTAGIQGARAQILAQVAGQQGATKDKDEAGRAAVTAKIQAIYEKTKKDVNDRLTKLDTDVTNAFDKGAADAKQAFESYVERRMNAYKDERYDGISGAAAWLSDKLTGMPEEVNVFFVEGRKLYVERMDAVLDTIAGLVETGLAEAKAKIVDGKQEIATYVGGLDPQLQQIGQEAAQGIQGKFSELEQSVDEKKDQLIDSLAQKYNEKLQQVDARIAEMKAANRGLVDKAMDAVGGVIETILSLKDMLLNVLAQAGDAIELIIADPIGFLGNLVSGVKQGFMNFVGNIGTHLQKGLIDWLLGALSQAGIRLPESFDLKGILSLVAQVLGLTWENIRARAVSLLGERVVSALEQAAGIVKKLMEEGIAGVWEMIVEQIGNLKDTILEQLKGFILEKVIVAGVTWIIGLLNPASAFIKACKAIYDIVMFFVERGSQIMELVNAIIGSITAIAKGSLGAAANFIENALAKAVPVVIGFLASLLGVGGISEKIRSVIEAVRAPINKAIDWLIKQAVKVAKAAGGLLGIGKDKKGKGAGDEKVDPEHDAKVAKGLAQIDEEEARYTHGGQIAREDAEQVAAKVKADNPIFKAVTVVDAGTRWDYAYVASEGKKEGEAKADEKAGQLSSEEAAIVAKLPGGPELLSKLPNVAPDKRRSLIEEARVALDAIRRGEPIIAIGKDIPRNVKGKGLLTEIDVETENELIQVKGRDYSDAKKLTGDDVTQLNATRKYNEQMRFEPTGEKSSPKKIVFHFTKLPVDPRLVAWLEARDVVVRVGL